MNTRGSETVIRIRLNPPDRFGDATEASRTDIPGCLVLPDNTEFEIQTFNQDVVTADFTLLLPKGSDVIAADSLIVRGVTYSVEGNPFELKSPITGKIAGIQVRLGVITG